VRSGGWRVPVDLRRRSGPGLRQDRRRHVQLKRRMPIERLCGRCLLHTDLRCLPGLQGLGGDLPEHLRQRIRHVPSECLHRRVDVQRLRAVPEEDRRGLLGGLGMSDRLLRCGHVPEHPSVQGVRWSRAAMLFEGEHMRRRPDVLPGASCRPVLSSLDVLQTLWHSGLPMLFEWAVRLRIWNVLSLRL
jgi:hypothetical protein